MRAVSILLLGGALVLSGCFLDRSAVPDYFVDAELSATRACKGDEITISWTSSPQRRSEGFCSCTADSACGDPASICFDGQCTIDGVSAADADGRCAEPAFVTILETVVGSSGAPRTIPGTRGASGSRTVTPDGSTRYDVVMNRSGQLKTAILEVVQLPDDGRNVNEFLQFTPPNCQPFIGPVTQDLADLAQPLVGSARVRISEVTQISAYDLVLSAMGPDTTPARGPVRMSGRSSDAGGAMNGPLGGIWSVQPTDVRPAVPNPGNCETQGGVSAPPIQLNIQMFCPPQ